MGWIFLLSGVSAESKKKITLCALCDSAVNYYKIRRKICVEKAIPLCYLLDRFNSRPESLRWLQNNQAILVTIRRIAKQLFAFFCELKETW